MSEVTLRVAGRNFEGWQSVQISKGLGTLAGVFSLQISNPWAPETTEWPIKIGQACEVLLDNKTVIMGYIEDVQSSFSSTHHDFSISGRNKTGDLVDCSVRNIDQLSEVTLATLCQEICRPFGIEVIDETGDQEKIRIFKVQPGETAFEAMNRQAKKKGVLIGVNHQGALILFSQILTAQHSGSKAILQQSGTSPETNNILEASIQFDASQRFQSYTVMAQHSDYAELDSEGSLQVEGSAQDEGVSRYRPLVLLAEAESTSASATKRAQWEATTRAARAVEINCLVDGWMDKSSVLWQPGALVHFKSDFFDIDADLLISEVTYSLDLSRGSITQLTLVRPDAFTPEPIKSTGNELWMQLLDN